MVTVESGTGADEGREGREIRVCEFRRRLQSEAGGGRRKGRNKEMSAMMEVNHAHDPYPANVHGENKKWGHNTPAGTHGRTKARALRNEPK